MKQSKKQFSIVVLTQILSAICQLLIIKFIAGELSTSEYGLLSLFLTFTILANQVCFVGIISASGRFYIKSFNENFVEKFYSSLIFVFLINSIISVILGILLSFLFNVETVLSIKMILLVLFEATYQIFNSINNHKDERKLVLYHVSFYYFLRLIILILILYFFDTQNFNFESAINAFFISVVITFIIQYLPKYRLISSISKIDFKKYYKNIFKYIFPFYIFGFINFLNQGIDKWIIKFFLDESYVGIYTLFFQYGFSPLILIATSLTSYLGPIYYNLEENENKKEINDLKNFFLYVIIIGSIIAIFLSYIFGDILIIFIGNGSYLEYTYLLPFFVLAACLSSATQLLNLEFFTKMDTFGYAFFNLINAFILISFFTIGLYFFHLIGAVIALVISHFTAYVLIYFHTKNFFNEK